MLQPQQNIPEWTIREKLCLASIVMRMSENNWSSVSKQMKQLTDDRRPVEFFSQKNCAQQYTNLVDDTLGPQKRRRTGDNLPTADSVASQLVSKLSFARLDELKRIISQEKLIYKKMRKEIEAIKSGEYDHQLEVMLEEMEQEERANGEIYGESESKKSFDETKFSPSDDNSNEFGFGGSSDETNLVVETPSPTKKDVEFSSPIQFSQTFLDPQTPHSSPSKAPVTPISVVHPAHPIVSPSFSPVTVFTQFSPTNSLSRSPPQKLENLSVNREELFIPKTTEIKIETDNDQKPVPFTLDVEPKLEDGQKVLIRPTDLMPMTAGQRHRHASGGSTSSDNSSAMARESVSSRSPHPIPSHFPDLETYRTWKRMIMSVFTVAAGHKHANLFNKPVMDDQAPNYSRIVHRPMCLSELKKSIDTQQVTTVAEFRRDLLLIFTNAIMYNPRSHMVNKMATIMANDVVPRMEELLAPPAKVESTPGSKTLRSLRTSVKQEGTPTPLEKNSRKRENSEAFSAENSKRKC